MRTTNSEMLLALRSPQAGWLAILACVLDEASRDPGFDARQRALVAELLQRGTPLPESVAEAARARASRFETELASDMSFTAEPTQDAPERPKLTLVDNR